MKQRMIILSVCFIICFLTQVSVVGAESIFQSFNSDPYLDEWSRTGDECKFDYNVDEYTEIDVWMSPDVQRFITPLSKTYNETTEFWVEWDWQGGYIYTWPRALFGVFYSGSDNASNVIGLNFQRRKWDGTNEELQRGVAMASDGTQISFDLPGFIGGREFVGRSKLHYYQNEAGEGIVEIEIWDILSGSKVTSGTKRVLAPGKKVFFNLFGIANGRSDKSSPLYHDEMKIDNLYFSTEGHCDAYFESIGKLRPEPSWIRGPIPDPIAWVMPPTAFNSTQIKMEACDATGSGGVQYYFENITDPSHSSGWQNSSTWIDKGLNDNASYAYRVKVRDKSLARRETAWSEEATAITLVETDVNAPRPDPVTWSQEPKLMGCNTISMTAEAVIDEEGNDPIEYYFVNLTDPTRDSGWQQSPTYVDERLEYDREYSYSVKARDSSANRNETALSDVITIRTLPRPSLTTYLRKSMEWDCPTLGTQVPLKVYFKKESNISSQGAPVIVYVMNIGYPRIGQEPDEIILDDLINDGYILITVDFEGNPDAISPNFDWDLHELFRAVYGYRTNSIIADVNLKPIEYLCWFLPAGYRIARDVVFFELDKHGSFGTVERIMSIYNSYVVDNFGVAPVTVPEDMILLDGSPIDYKLRMDIIYPSQSDRKVPLIFWNSTESMHNMLGGPHTNRPHMVGFLMRGYAYANIDHTTNPLARHWAYEYMPSYELDEWNGVKAVTAGIRYLRMNAEEYNIDQRYIAGWGHSKGSYTITRLSDPEHCNKEVKEFWTFAGFPEGSPQPQPWQGYSSQITAGYQSMGAGTRRTEYLNRPFVPTLIAVGELDQFNHWLDFPRVVNVYESLDLNHLALWMPGIGHDLPRGYDEVLDVDRYQLCATFFDQYMKVEENLPPEVLYILPVDGNDDVSVGGYNKSVPSTSLPVDATDYVSLTSPISVHFAPNMDLDSVINGGIKVIRVNDGSPVAGTWTSSRENTLFTFKPAEELLVNESYRIVVTTAVKNQRGVHLLEERSVEFKVSDE